MRQGHWRQMLRLDIIGSAFAISVFLLFYYTAVGFFVVFFATTLRLPAVEGQRPGQLVLGVRRSALIVTGLLSDRLKVRKPFMVVGGDRRRSCDDPLPRPRRTTDTTYYHFVVDHRCPRGGPPSRSRRGWRASPRPSRSTTRRRPRPAWPCGAGSSAWSSRISVAVPAVRHQLDDAACHLRRQVAQMSAQYSHGAGHRAGHRPGDPGHAPGHPDGHRGADQGRDRDRRPRSRSARPTRRPSSSRSPRCPRPTCCSSTRTARTSRTAAANAPGQWKAWWWVCVGGMVLFLPFIFVMTGRWSPRKAKAGR